MNNGKVHFGGRIMTQLLSKLASDCAAILRKDNGPKGRDKVAELLSDLLADAANVKTLIPEDIGERELLYEDPDLGFCILAHNYDSPKTAPPHDHGAYWAIYAQARGETEMKDYDVLSPATVDRPGKVSVSRTYHLRVGDVHVYNEGDIHSPHRSGPTSLLRIEGTDMSKVQRLRYQLA
jgi:hypothetical protein